MSASATPSHFAKVAAYCSTDVVGMSAPRDPLSFGPPRASDGPDADATLFYSSPKRPSPFRLVQILRGGTTATQVCARETSVTVGREGCDMNFPNDPYMSTRHCKVELTSGGAYQLTDSGSKNGTYLAIHGERELAHGDYLFIGRELLRVDISA